MSISLIWAMDRNRLVGKNNAMPWHLPNDMAFFRKHTQGKTVVMGRKTFESIGSKPLPKRHNIVLTRSRDWTHEGVEVLHGIEEVLVRGKQEDLMIIGGPEIYKQFLPFADQLYMTRIDETFDGDAYFPAYDDSEWELIETIPGVVDDRNLYPREFLIYKRIHEFKR